MTRGKPHSYFARHAHLHITSLLPQPVGNTLRFRRGMAKGCSRLEWGRLSLGRIKRDLIQVGAFGFKTGIPDPSPRDFCTETISLSPPPPPPRSGSCQPSVVRKGLSSSLGLGLGQVGQDGGADSYLCLRPEAQSRVSQRTAVIV